MVREVVVVLHVGGFAEVDLKRGRYFGKGLWLKQLHGPYSQRRE